MKNSFDETHPQKSSRKEKIKVEIVNQYILIQQSLKLLVENNSDMCVTGYHNDFDDLLKTLEVNKPDVILVYLSDGDGETLEQIPKLSDHLQNVRIVVVAGSKDIREQVRALELGAVGIVQKEQNSKMLIESIRQTYKGETWINQSLLSKLLKGQNQDKNEGLKSGDSFNIGSLTAREQQVIAMIGEGLKNKEIAKKLFISEATVRHHLSSIYGKLEVADRLNLVIYAYQKGLL